MSTYAIGDIQGCIDPLLQLLEHIHFNSKKDQLWFCGDLVNRGPNSLETLRFIKSLGDNAICVLGNHDLHLLALSNDHPRAKKHHTLDDILNAPDSEELIDWLRHRPVMHSDKKLGFHMVHAGLPPQWSIKQAQQAARELEDILSGEHYSDFLNHMYGNTPDLWNKKLSGIERWRFITNCFTRLRYCHADGHLNFKEKGRPDKQASDLYPWYAHPDRKSIDGRILFGHWSTLGYQMQNNCWALDSGCLWGGKLTALHLENPKQVYQLDCQQQSVPG